MRKINKTLILSAAAAVAFGAVAAGTTYALFTSEAEADIAVTSGKVAVKSEVLETSIQTKQLYETEFTDGKDAMFGGKVSIEGNTVNLSNMVPGDAVKFSINVTDESTVATKIRSLISTSDDTGLAEALKIKIDGEEFPGLAVTQWEKVEAGEGDRTVTVEIELPEETGDEYQDKTCSLVYSVEAVQGNAATKDAVVVTPETTTFTLEDNTDVYFAPGEYGDYSLYFHGKENIGLIGSAGAKFTNFTAGYHGGQDGSLPSKTDSKFVADGLAVEKKLSLFIADQEFEAKNCKASQIYASTNKIDGMDIKFTNNTLKRAESFAYSDTFQDPKNGGIFLWANTADYSLSITGNSFENYIGHATKVMGNSNLGGCKSITIKGNNYISFGYTKADPAAFDPEDPQSAFKIWGDNTYTPAGTLSEETENLQKALAKEIYDNNTFSEIIKSHKGLYAAEFDRVDRYELYNGD